MVDLLANNLKTESSPPKKIDLFFLIDSIAQCSIGMKGNLFLSVFGCCRSFCLFLCQLIFACSGNAGIYPSVIQPLLPRLLLAAAPPGTTFYENHKLCLKVSRAFLQIFSSGLVSYIFTEI